MIKEGSKIKLTNLLRSHSERYPRERKRPRVLPRKSKTKRAMRRSDSSDWKT